MGVATLAAAAAEQRVADHRDVVEPAQRRSRRSGSANRDERATGRAAAGGCRRSGSCRPPGREARGRRAARRRCSPQRRGSAGIGEQRRAASSRARARSGIERIRRARSDRRARPAERRGATSARPGIPAGRRAERAPTSACSSIDLIERLELARGLRSAVRRSHGCSDCNRSAATGTGRRPIVAAGQHRRRERLQPVGRVRLRRRALEPFAARPCSRAGASSARTRCRGSTATSAAGRDPLAQERDRLIGPARPARIALAQEDRAEAVGDGEVRIERRRQDRAADRAARIFGRRASRLVEPIAAVVLDRADPVDVGRERVEPEASGASRGRRPHVQARASAPHRLAGRRGRASTCSAKRRRGRDTASPIATARLPARRHLKSRREKISVAARSSAAMYASP